MPKLHKLIYSTIDKILFDIALNQLPQILLKSLFDSTNLKFEQPNLQKIAKSDFLSQSTELSKKKRLKFTIIFQNKNNLLKEQIVGEKEESLQQLTQKKKKS